MYYLPLLLLPLLLLLLLLLFTYQTGWAINSPSHLTGPTV